MKNPPRLDLEKETGVRSGVVLVQNGFGNLYPTNRRLPRASSGKLAALCDADELINNTNIKINVIQIPIFPGTDESDTGELMKGLRDRGFEPQIIMMVTEGDPMEKGDEDKVSNLLRKGIQVAKRYRIKGVASTSLEGWMKDGAKEKSGKDYTTGASQLAKLHARVYTEEKLGNGSINSWNIEFLRPGEMATFTTLKKAWEVVKAMNEKVGKPFFKVLVDSAHCGDSGEGIDATKKLLKKMIQAGDVNMVHGSVATTRGHHASDEGMRAAVISTAVRSGVKLVVDEVFNHEDGALDKLIRAKLGFGIDTGLGRMSSTQILAANVYDTVLRILTLKARGLVAKSEQR